VLRPAACLHSPWVPLRRVHSPHHPDPRPVLRLIRRFPDLRVMLQTFYISLPSVVNFGGAVDVLVHLVYDLPLQTVSQFGLCSYALGSVKIRFVN
jgi:hypothetical protein